MVFKVANAFYKVAKISLTRNQASLSLRKNRLVNGGSKGDASKTQKETSVDRVFDIHEHYHGLGLQDDPS